MKLRQAQYQFIVVIYVANPMKIGGANIDYNNEISFKYKKNIKIIMNSD